MSIIHRKEWFVPEQFWSFGLGLFLLSAISFLDDILDLSTKLRLVFHFLSVVLLIYFLGLWNVLPFWLLPIAFIFIIGVLNAYNFMDGINGITGVYSLVALATLYYVNQFKISFADIHFIVYPIFACLVFLFFNFRKIARCFAGDVGSMSIAFWVLALLGALVVKTKDFTYFLFLGVYGIEVVSTIIQRIKMKENILEAHRHHLYQLLVNKMNWQHLSVAALYGAIQLAINFSIIHWEFNFGKAFYI
jgi:UDP-N-acetylmuramyl pentapeptide phosphotransferase/UDP-N-acetylglucosamine-1-phosphate transferase